MGDSMTVSTIPHEEMKKMVNNHREQHIAEFEFLIMKLQEYANEAKYNAEKYKAKAEQIQDEIDSVEPTLEMKNQFADFMRLYRINNNYANSLADTIEYEKTQLFVFKAEYGKGHR